MIRLPSLMPLVALSLTLSLAACGGEDDKKDPTDSGATADAVSDTEADAGAKDTGSATKDTGGGAKDAGSTAQDTGPAPKTACDVALLCQQECGKGDKSCLDGCVDNVADADKTKLGDIATCAVDMCKDVTEGTAAEQDCAFDKCYDKYADCGAFGGGSAGCTATVACLASCTLTDFACTLRCMQGADKGALTSAKGVASCVATKCKGVKGEAKLADCISKECASEVGTCLGKESFGCPDIHQWVSKCAASSQLEPNNCRPIMMGMADAAGRAAFDAYDGCKDQCSQAVNVVGCWIDKCSKEAAACFATNGAKNCQDVAKCVDADCDGVGGESGCIKTCMAKAKATSQDAYLIYEGCMTRNMDTKEAKTAKCKFPYSQDKCIPVIKGQFCGNESQNCFTDQ